MSYQNLVKLPCGNFVNPKYVTSIELEKYDGEKSNTIVWVVKNAGYGTGKFTYSGDQRDSLAKLIGFS